MLTRVNAMKAVGRSDLGEVQAGAPLDNEGAQSRPDVRGVPTCTNCHDQPKILVSDNLPAVPAITDAELDAIERYMGDILDMVLGGNIMPPISDREDRLS